MIIFNNYVWGTSQIKSNKDRFFVPLKMTVVIRHLEQNILQRKRNVTKKNEKSKKIPKQVRNDN